MIGFIDTSFKIVSNHTHNHNNSQSIYRRRLAPFSLSLSVSFSCLNSHSDDCSVLLLIQSQGESTDKNCFCCQECVFIGPLPSNGCSLFSRIVVCTTQKRAVYQEPDSAGTCLSSHCLTNIPIRHNILRPTYRMHR
jgi:hypothetical protein